MRKIKKNKPFTWTNNAELDKLSELNKKINAGLTLEKARNEFIAAENDVSKHFDCEKKIAELKKESAFFNDLYNQAIQCFVENNPTNKALDYLTEHRITADNYYKLKDVLIADNEKEIAEIEQSLSADRAKLSETAATLEMLERVAGGTYVQNLIDEEKKCRQGKYMNGYKPASGRKL